MSFAATAVGVGAAVGSGVMSNQAAQSGVGVGQSMRKTLSGYGQALPAWLALNQQYNPQWNALGAQSTRDLLFGSQGTSGTEILPFWMRHMQGAQKAWQNPDTGEISTTKQRGWDKVATLDWTRPGGEGLLDVAGDATRRFTQLGVESADMAREADVAALAKYMPAYREQYEQAAPELMALRRQIGLDAQRQLGAGDQLGAGMAARARNATYGQFADRGFSPATGAVNAQALMDYTGMANAMGNQRRGYALDASRQLAETQPDYMRFILGQQGAMPSAMSFIQSQQPLTYAKNYDPLNQTSSQIQQTAAATRQAGYSSMADTLGGMAGGMFSIAGNMGGRPKTGGQGGYNAGYDDTYRTW